MSSTRTMGVGVTETDTTQRLPLGFEYVEPADATNDYGSRVWIYVQMTSSAAAQGDILMKIDGSLGLYKGILATVALHSRLRIIGVAQHAIAENSYGFVLRRGVGAVTAGDGAGITVNQAFTTAGTTQHGTALNFADGAEEAVIGFCLITTAAEATTAKNAYVNCGG